jgi:hypothetical protein
MGGHNKQAQGNGGGKKEGGAKGKGAREMKGDGGKKKGEVQKGEGKKKGEGQKPKGGETNYNKFVKWANDKNANSNNWRNLSGGSGGSGGNWSGPTTGINPGEGGKNEQAAAPPGGGNQGGPRSRRNSSIDATYTKHGIEYFKSDNTKVVQEFVNNTHENHWSRHQEWQDLENWCVPRFFNNKLRLGDTQYNLTRQQGFSVERSLSHSHCFKATPAFFNALFTTKTPIILACSGMIAQSFMGGGRGGPLKNQGPCVHRVLSLVMPNCITEESTPKKHKVDDSTRTDEAGRAVPRDLRAFAFKDCFSEKQHLNIRPSVYDHDCSGPGDHHHSIWSVACPRTHQLVRADLVEWTYLEPGTNHLAAKALLSDLGWDGSKGQLWLRSPTGVIFALRDGKDYLNKPDEIRGIISSAQGHFSTKTTANAMHAMQPGTLDSHKVSDNQNSGGYGSTEDRGARELSPVTTTNPFQKHYGGLGFQHEGGADPNARSSSDPPPNADNASANTSGASSIMQSAQAHGYIPPNTVTSGTVAGMEVAGTPPHIGKEKDTEMGGDVSDVESRGRDTDDEEGEGEEGFRAVKKKKAAGRVGRLVRTLDVLRTRHRGGTRDRSRSRDRKTRSQGAHTSPARDTGVDNGMTQRTIESQLRKMRSEMEDTTADWLIQQVYGPAPEARSASQKTTSLMVCHESIAGTMYDESKHTLFIFVCFSESYDSERLARLAAQVFKPGELGKSLPHIDQLRLMTT